MAAPFIGFVKDYKTFYLTRNISIKVININIINIINTIFTTIVTKHLK